jgi:hypothetical protein
MTFRGGPPPPAAGAGGDRRPPPPQQQQQQPGRKRCHFFESPGGCRNGASCKFLHVGSGAARGGRGPPDGGGRGFDPGIYGPSKGEGGGGGGGRNAHERERQMSL